MTRILKYCILILISVSLITCSNSKASKNRSKTIEDIAINMNATCPLRLDQIVTLNKVKFEEPETVHFFIQPT